MRSILIFLLISTLLLIESCEYKSPKRNNDSRRKESVSRGIASEERDSEIFQIFNDNEEYIETFQPFNNSQKKNQHLTEPIEHLQNLKAVLIVGHTEESTISNIEMMNKIANLLNEKGIKVYKFYDSKADWNEITKISGECSFFVYAGHGSTMGENRNAGGICVTSMISTSELLSTLKLKNNALVIFISVCNGAGSSATDITDIGINEAKKRVIHYADPFFKIGATAYYANNFIGGAYKFLEDFLSGITLKLAFTKSTELTNIEFEEPFPRDSSKSFSISSIQSGEFGQYKSNENSKNEKVKFPKRYNIAYVGNSTFSIRDMN